jgi:ribose transport system substrate-binding protein
MSYMLETKKKVLAAASVALLLTLAAGCGSDDSSSEASAPATAPASTAPAADAGGAVAGVPTLDELYKGSEETPPTEGPKAVPGKKIIWVSCGQVTPGCSHPAELGKAPAKQLGWSYKIVDAKLNANGGFASAIRQAIAEQPDAIITHGFDCNVGKQALQDAKDAGIPVIGVVNFDCDETGDGAALQPIKMIVNSKDKGTGDMLRTFGAQKAAYIIDKTDGQAKVINMHLSDTGKIIQEGFMDMLGKCAACKVVEDVPYTDADSTPTGPLPQKASIAIQRHPDANALSVTYDTTLGYAAVGDKLNSIPAAKKLTITGGEGTAVGMGFLREKDVPTAEFAYDNDWIAWATMDTLNRYFAKSPQVPQGWGTRAVDRDHNMTPSGAWTTKVDFKSAYQKIWTGQ